MRLGGLPLLAALLAALPATAAGTRVDVSAPGSDGRFAVSWRLPAGLEESELLLEVENGPRVRLTAEQRDRHPRVLVTLPALVGAARFVVRAGGHGKGEQDVGASEAFLLEALPASGPVPVRAPASRPVPGSEMEWWSERPPGAAPGPAPGLSTPRISDAGASSPLPVLHSPRTRLCADTVARSPSVRPERASVAGSTRSRVLGTAFRGAPVPLRN